MAKVKKKTLANYKDDFVTVFPTEKNKFHKQGEPIELHPDAAAHLIKKGLAKEEEDEKEVTE